jgi:PKD repeat protein
VRTRAGRPEPHPTGRSPRLTRTIALLTGLAVSAATLLPTGAALADSAPTDPASPRTPKTVTADVLPTPQIDGVVWDQLVVGDTVYVAGEFSSARPFGAPAGTGEVTRSNFLAYDLDSGALRTDIAPSFNAQIRSLAASPDGKRLYAAGSFTSVSGQTRYRLAAFDLPSMTLVSSFRPTISATVEAVAVTADSVYITGVFGTVQKETRARAAALAPSNAALLPWAPAVVGGTSKAIAISPDGSKVVLAGSFTTLNGSNDPGLGIGAVTADTGASLPWKMNSILRNGGTKSSFMDLSSDGDSVYGVGYQHSQGGQATEGTFRASWSDGSLVWLADCHGDTYSVEAVGDVVYTAGHNHACDNTGGFPNDPNGYHRAVAYSKSSYGSTIHNQPPAGWTYGNFAGNPATNVLHWYPDFDAGTYTGLTQGPWDVTAGDGFVLYGGEFTSIDGTKQQGLARFATSDVAPNAKGPQLSGSAMNPTVSVIGDGIVRVSWPANTDIDNASLTYEVVRDGRSEPRYTVTAESSFYDRPTLSFVDDGIEPGSTHTYRVRTLDPFGNATSSGTVSFTMVGAGETDPVPATSYDAAILADVPSHYWPFNEPTGLTSADWAGASTQTIQGSPVERGVAGVEADGSGASTRFGGTARTTSGPVEPLSNTVSLEAWIKTTTTTGGLIVGASNDNGGNRDRLLYMGNDGRLHFGVYPGSVRMVDSDERYNDGAWHHVVATLGQGGQQLFVDGALVDSRTDTYSAQSYSGFWAIGGYSLSGWPDRPSSDSFSGSIDNVAVYRTQLTAAEVAAHTEAIGGDVVPDPDPEPVNVAPTASFTASATDLTVAFDASASRDPDGSTLEYAWEFGDSSPEGDTASGVTATHTFSAAGAYDVVLTVTDADGASATAQKTVTVVAPEPEEPAGPAPVAADDFARSQTSGWGAASTGGSWSVTGGASGFSVANGSGRMANTPGQTRTAMLNGVAVGDSETRVSFSLDQLPVGGGQYVQLNARQVGSDKYTARVRVQADGVLQLQVQRSGTTLKAVNLSHVAYERGDVVTLAVGLAPNGSATTVSAKAWIASETTEPSAWQVAASDATPTLQQPGAVGLTFYLSGSASAATTVAFSGYSVTPTE